jgi:DNA-binding CsgD family transcriptional regulator
VVDAYNQRFINPDSSLLVQKNILKDAIGEKNIKQTLVSESFLVCTYLRLKQLDSAQNHISALKLLNEKSSNFSDNELGYYYYAFFRYKYYLDDEGQKNDLLKAYDYFKKANNNDFACLTAISIAYLGEQIDSQYHNLAIFYANQSTNLDIKLEAQICHNSYLKQIFARNDSFINKDSILAEYKKSIVYAKSPHILLKHNQGTAYLNYANFLSQIGVNHSEVDSYLDSALSIAKKYNLTNVIRNSYGQRGYMYIQDKKYNEAKLTFLQGIDYIQHMSYKEYSIEMTFYEHLKIVSKLLNQMDEYYKYDTAYQRVSAQNEEFQNQQSIQNAIAKYELKAKDETITALYQKDKLKNWVFALVAIMGLLGIYVFTLRNKSFKLSQKIEEAKQRELQTEKEQVQKELMNSILHIEKKNEILNNLKEKLNAQNEVNIVPMNNSIFKTLEDGLLVDESFEKFKNNFNSIYPEFFTKLQAKANHSLTQLDLKYCGFMLMKLSNKEIANQMNVEPKSIRMARYRIKQKLSLTKEEDLDEFVQSLVS